MLIEIPAESPTSERRRRVFGDFSAHRLGISFALNFFRWSATSDSSTFRKTPIPNPKFYTGLSSDVIGRLADHNAGRCPHTVSHRPWQRHVVIEFSDERRAIRFERYLKSGSGRAFAKRHFEGQ
jgi:putative endonuclease